MPVLEDAPAIPGEPPQPRYYRVRPRRHGVAAGIALAAVVVSAGALVLSSDLLDEPADEAVATLSDDGAVLVTGAVPEVAGDDAPVARAPLPVAPVEVELDVRSVTVVGDSITAASADSIRATLGAEDVETIDIVGRERRRIGVGNGTREEPLAGVDEIRQLIAKGANPDVWVIALGTNDVSLYPDAAAYGQLVDSVLELIPEDAPLVWVDVYRPRQQEHTAMFNEVLHDRLDRRPDAAIAPWHAFASSPDQRILRKDDLHPNAAGTEVFAQVITAGIADATSD
jgi:lysophospholipase L1-like esterase